MATLDELDSLLFVTGHRKRLPTRQAGSTIHEPVEPLPSPAKSDDGLIEKLRSFNGRPIKARELAKIVGCSKETVLRRAKSGMYPSFRQGRTVYFNPVALIRYFQSKGVR